MILCVAREAHWDLRDTYTGLNKRDEMLSALATYQYILLLKPHLTFTKQHFI